MVLSVKQLGIKGRNDQERNLMRSYFVKTFPFRRMVFPENSVCNGKNEKDTSISKNGFVSKLALV